MEEKAKDSKELIEYNGQYGGIFEDSKYFDDSEDFGKEDLLNYKIINVKIYSGLIEDKKTIFGISLTFKNIITGEIKSPKVHLGSEKYLDVKELSIQSNEYLTDFHIRFNDTCEYISQLGFSTNLKRHILEGCEEGNDKIIEKNGGNYIIVGTIGYINKKLDSIGCITVSKKEYLKKEIFKFLALRYKIQKDEKFKKEWEEKYNELPEDFKYLWRAINLPNTAFMQILKFCFL